MERAFAMITIGIKGLRQIERFEQKLREQEAKK